jgi:hypothetical protein
MFDQNLMDNEDDELRSLRSQFRSLTIQLATWIASMIVLALIALMLIFPGPAASAPPVLPTINGETIGQVGVMLNRLGWHGHFYYRGTQDGQPAIFGVTWNCLHANPKCGTKQATDAYLAILAAPDKIAAARAAWDANFTDVCSTAAAGSDQKILCDVARYHMCENFPVTPKPAVCTGITLPTIPDPPPPATGWVVAATTICAAQDKDGTGRCVRRQSFTWDGKVRGTVAQPERATIGSPCITTIGISPYFGFDAARSDRVVQCVKR